MSYPHKQLTRRLVLLPVLLALLGGGVVWWLTLNKAGQPSSVSCLLLSHNTADIQNNPLEYRSTLAYIAAHAPTPQLQEAARKMVEVDDAWEQTGGKVKEQLQESSLRRLVSTFKKKLPVLAPKGKVKNWVRHFLNKHGEQEITVFLQARRFGYALDKHLRQRGGIRCSPTAYSPEMKAYFRQHPTFDEEAFLETWLTTILPEFSELYAMSTTKDEFLVNCLATYLFDRYIITLIYNAKAAQAWCTLLEALEASGMGDEERKNAQLIDHYTQKQASVLFLQEANSSMVTALRQAGYQGSPELEALLEASHDAQRSLESVVLYQEAFIKELFGDAPVCTHHFAREEVLALAERVLKPWEIELLLEKESRVAMHTLEQGSHLWLFVSFHASSSGDNVLHFLRLLFKLQERLATEQQKKVFVVIGGDMNTSQEAHGKKQFLDPVEKMVEAHGCKIVSLKEEATTDKERSYLQVQLYKAHKQEKNLSDLIIVSSEIVVEEAGVGPYGPSMENASDHRAIHVRTRLPKNPQANT